MIETHHAVHASSLNDPEKLFKTDKSHYLEN